MWKAWACFPTKSVLFFGYNPGIDFIESVAAFSNWFGCFPIGEIS